MADCVDDGVSLHAKRSGPVHDSSGVRSWIFRDHPGLCAGIARIVSRVRGLVAHSDVAPVQRRGDGARRLARRPSLRSFRLLCARLRRGSWRQYFQSDLDRDSGRPRALARGVRLRNQVRDGLISQTPARMPRAIAAVPSAAQVWAATSAVVAAQAIEENASANVARRDEVCLRRNWLRRACTRKQSWLTVAAAAAVNMPRPQTMPAKTVSTVKTATIGAKTSAIIPMTASTLANRMRCEVSAR